MFKVVNGVQVPLTEEEINQKLREKQEALEEAQKVLEARVKAKRNQLLLESDWTQLVDSPISDEEKVLWQEYRQALRDITKQSNYPNYIEWPAKP